MFLASAAWNSCAARVFPDQVIFKIFTKIKSVFEKNRVIFMETLAKTKEINQMGVGGEATQSSRFFAENKPYFSVEMALRVPQNDIIF